MSDQRQAGSRGVGLYAKPALSEHDLLNRWEQRGLVLGDRARATRYLKHIGYYRLSAYVRSFQGSERDVLRPGTRFDNVLSLYVFDRKLRLVVLDALERVEVAVRAALGDHMSRVAGSHWYEDSRYFSQSSVYQRLLNDVDRIVQEQRDRPREQVTGPESFVSALEHWVTRDGNPKRPPSWLILEELSFGTVRNV